MSNGERTPVIRSEDWWACFLGWFILILAIIGLSGAGGKWKVGLPFVKGPKIESGWSILSLGEAGPNEVAQLDPGKINRRQGDEVRPWRELQTI